MIRAFRGGAAPVQGFCLFVRVVTGTPDGAGADRQPCGLAGPVTQGFERFDQVARSVLGDPVASVPLVGLAATCSRSRPMFCAGGRVKRLGFD